MTDLQFDLKAPVRRISDREILDSLEAFRHQRGDSAFTTTEYDKWNKRVCTSATISERFRGWRQALKHVGVAKGVRAREYTAQELMDNLERVWRTLGYPPGKRRLSKYGDGVSERPYNKRWGSVRNACSLLAEWADF